MKLTLYRFHFSLSPFPLHLPSLPFQALQAAQFLDKIKLFGKPIRVTSSKHTTVQLPKEGAPDGGLTKDFSNSPLHRFKKPGSKNYANVFPPSATLHLSNIPPDVEEQTLVDAFGRHGHVKGLRVCVCQGVS